MATETRRRFLRGLAAGGILLPASSAVFARSIGGDELRAEALTMHNLHTGESLVIPADPSRLNRQSLAHFNVFLRDHYSGDVGHMDPDLLGLLARVRRELGTEGSISVISGYRSPATNAKLRRQSQRVAKHSLHMQGRAIDIRMPGVALSDLRDAAIDLKTGGVGFYRKSEFVHLDTGSFRTW